MAKSVTIMLDRERVMRLNMWAQMRYEKASGKKIVDMEENSVTDVMTLVWATLTQDDPELTVDALAQILDVDDMERVAEAIKELKGDIGESPLPKT